MYLRLNNIRQYFTKEVELPESGLIMIQGRSGAGKTTIFDSILEALYGKVSDIVTWGEKKSKIILEINNPEYMKIIRTRGPETLEVFDINGKKYKDDEAQMFINKSMGMNSHEFLSSCYIKQGMFGSLLSLTPSEQFEFIEQLSQSSGISDIFKKKIQKSIEIAISEQNDLEKECNFELEVQGVLEKNILDHKKMIFWGIKPEGNFDILLKSEDFISIETENKKQKITELEKIKNDNIYNYINDIEVLENVYKKSYQEYTDKLNSLLSQRDELEQKISNINVLSEEEEKTIEKKIKYIKILENIEDLKKQIIGRFGDIDDKIFAFLQNLKNKLSSEKNKLLDELENVKSNIKDANRLAQECPQCHASLYIDNGIITENLYTGPSLDNLNNNLIKIKHSVLKCEDDIKDIDIFLHTAEFLAKSLKSIGSEYKAEINDLPLFLTKMSENFNNTIKKNNLEQTLKSVKGNINDIINTLANKKAEIDEKKRKVDDFIKNPTYMSKEDIEKEIKKILIEIDSNNRELYTIKSKIKEFENYHESIERNKAIEVIINEKEKELDNRTSKIKEIKDKITYQQNKIASLKRLKEISDFAALSATEMIINHININAQYYLDKLFSDDGTTIKIKNHKLTKKGEERAKISIDVFHKGKIAKSINSLSGGEKSRACLAFQLALADIYKTKFLMIDEGFSGLSDIDKEICMEILQDVSKDRLVVVIEHNVSEAMFDSVVRV